MAWQDALISLRDELAEVRAQRLRQAQEREAEETAEVERLRGVIQEISESLEVVSLLDDMNRLLLSGQGTLETFASWEEEGDENDDHDGELDESGLNLVSLNGADSDEDSEEMCLSLIWEEAGERIIEIEIGSEESKPYLMVNGVNIRLERSALEQAALAAFREELEL